MAKVEGAFLITLCGAGGTGKTTTSDGFMMTEAGLEFVAPPSASRKVAKRWGLESEDEQAELNLKEFDKLQREITQTWVDDINTLLAEGKKVISDRSAIDHMAYTHLKWAQRRHLGLDRGTWEEQGGESIAADLFKWIEGVAARELAKVDILGFFPAGLFEPPAEEFRTQSETERRAVDILMRGLIWKFKKEIPFPLAEFYTPSADTRIAHLEHFACKLLGKPKVGHAKPGQDKPIAHYPV